MIYRQIPSEHGDDVHLGIRSFSRLAEIQGERASIVHDLIIIAATA